MRLPDRLGLPIPLSVPIGRGGYLGALINTWLNEHLAFTGGLIFLLAVFSVGLLLSTEYAVIRYLGFATTGGMTLFKALAVAICQRLGPNYDWQWNIHRSAYRFARFSNTARWESYGLARRRTDSIV